MKKVMLIWAALILFSANFMYGQWTKKSSVNVGVSGRMLATDSAVFFYGSQGSFALYRSSDKGITWTNIADKFPYDVYYMYEYKNEIFAVTTTLGLPVYRFYVSGDGGQTWSERSNIPEVTGNGAVLHMSSDGSVLYACSNRRSYYTSTDDGATWKETIINTSAGGNVIMMVGVGTDLISVFPGTGTVVSTDGGQTWNVNNPASTAIAIVYSLNGNIYGLSFGAGIFKWNKETKAWFAVNNGVPDNGTYQIPTSMAVSGKTIYAATRGLLTGKTIILSSSNEGSSWSTVDMTGLPTLSGAASSTFMSSNSNGLYLFNYLFVNGTSNNESTGVFYSETVATGIENEIKIPAGFELSQNYPNPFNPSTTIFFQIPTANVLSEVEAQVTLKVYDVLGREVTTLVNDHRAPGNYEVKFDAGNLASGIYYYSLKSGGYGISKKMILSK